MITRIVTAIVVLLIFLPATFLLPSAGWISLALLLTVAAAIEWARLTGLVGVIPTATYAGLVVICAFVVTTFPMAKIVIYVFASIFWLLIAPYLLFKHADTHQSIWSKLLGLILLPAVFEALVELREMSASILLAIMAVAWVSDSLAYFTGRAFGRHKLAPLISPGKTWEGAVGGLIGVAIYAILCFSLGWKLMSFMNLSQMILLWLALAVAGIVGDLFESLMKRSAGVKDSGNVLPGHGGVLDRVDALLPIMPLAAIVHQYMAA